MICGGVFVIVIGVWVVCVVFFFGVVDKVVGLCECGGEVG